MPILNITGGAAIEGSFGQDQLITYELTLDEPASTDVTIDYAARAGTAGVDTDFDALTTTLTSPVGATSAQIVVRTNAEVIAETDESVLVDFFNLDGADFANGQEIVTVQSVILDDDGTGLDRAVFVGDATIIEGDNGAMTAEFEVRLSQASDSAISINYQTEDGSAIAGSDYVATSGVLNFAPGQTSQTVSVPVNGDTSVEGLEQFSLVVEQAGRSNPLFVSDDLAVDFAAGVGTILDDDASGLLPSLSVVGEEIVEGSFGQDNLIFYTVTLTEPALSTVSFDYSAVSGTARFDTDFDVINATLTIPAGETTGRFSVRTNAEAVDEADESVHVVLNNLDGAVFSNG